MKSIVVDRPQILCAEIASTGPLARSLFFFGWTEEQALVFNIKNKGLVIFTGCGHPTLEVIVSMVRKMSDTKIYAIGGGLHFPIKNGRGAEKVFLSPHDSCDYALDIFEKELNAKIYIFTVGEAYKL